MKIEDLINTSWNKDCLDFMAEIPDNSIDMILCDLPFGSTQNKWDVIIPFNLLWLHYQRIIKHKGVTVLFGIEPFSSLLRVSNLAEYKYDWVWKKSQAVGHLNAWRQPMRNTENISVFYKSQPIYNPILTDKPKANIRPVTSRTKTSTNYGNHKLDVHKCPPDKSMPATIIEFNNEQNTIHPTQKPVKLAEYLIKTYTNEGDLVLDNCAGSFTAAIAAINTNRNYICIEKDEDYYIKGIERIAKHPVSLAENKTSTK